MATQSITPRQHRRPSVDYHREFPFTRGARIGFLFLLLITIVFAAAALFIKLQLESFRAQVEASLETELHANMTIGAVSVNGFRGLRIDNLEVEIPIEGGPVASLVTPTAFVNIDLNDLLYGDITLDRIVLDGTRIVIERPLDAAWYSYDNTEIEDVLPGDFARSAAFRLSGVDCSLLIRNIVGDTQLEIANFEFDLWRLVDAPDLSATLAGDLSHDLEKHIEAKLTMSSLDDFDIRVQTDLLTAEDVNVILPAQQHLVSTGQTRPTLRVSALPKAPIVVSLQAPFEDLVVRDQPEFFEPATGTLTVLAAYDPDSHVLAVTTAQAESEELAGEVEGTISFAGGEYPEFDLRLQATKMPFAEILNDALEGQFDEYGAVDMTLHEPHELIVTLEGTTDEPIVRAAVSAGSGDFSYIPNEPDQPPVTLALGAVQGAWNPATQTASGRLDVVGGRIYDERSAIEATDISGTVTLLDGIVSAAPINATITGNAFVGSLRYDLESGDADVTLNGTLSGLEHTGFHDMIKDTGLAGSIGIKAEATKRGDRYGAEAELDATQSQVDYKWWFKKPPGVGAKGLVLASFEPGKSAEFSTKDAEVASSDFSARVRMGHGRGPNKSYYVQSAECMTQRLDINGTAKCVDLPYRLTGGNGYFGHMEWKRDPHDFDANSMTAGLYVDEASLIALHADATTPLVCRDIAIEATFHTNQHSTGDLWIYAQEASMPPLGVTWFVPLTPPPDYPILERDWTYTIVARAMELPPWKGTNFSGEAYSTVEAVGLNQYTATIDEGRLAGNYHAIREENTYEAQVNWADVPAHYFIDHLQYPEVLEGLMTGEVTYSIDSDDPSTLDGNGYFEISDGRFSADFLYTMLQGTLSEGGASLPPSLDFSHLRADVGFEGDTVKTPTLKLDSEGLLLEGSGQYIRDGDMDYAIKVAVSPATAERIPILNDNFNIQGHKMSQQDLELAFRIGGPTFKPRGELAELPPASVTLVSGALEVGREAFNIIDLPRKILVDLLRIGGTIVGAGTSNRPDE